VFPLVKPGIALSPFLAGCEKRGSLFLQVLRVTEEADGGGADGADVGVC
jgi:hypothetical protein